MWGIMMGELKTGEGTRTALQFTCCTGNEGATICCPRAYLHRDPAVTPQAQLSSLTRRMHFSEAHSCAREETKSSRYGMHFTHWDVNLHLIHARPLRIFHTELVHKAPRYANSPLFPNCIQVHTQKKYKEEGTVQMVFPLVQLPQEKRMFSGLWTGVNDLARVSD